MTKAQSLKRLIPNLMEEDYYWKYCEKTYITKIKKQIIIIIIISSI